MEPIITVKNTKTGNTLKPKGTNLYTDGERDYPFIHNILYIRDKPEFRDQAVDLIQEGKIDEATALLLRDQDAFSTNVAPPVADIVPFLENLPTSLTAAMNFLNYGGVTAYFAARWSSPTFVAGLALLQNLLEENRLHIEVACGIGQFLKIVENNGLQAVGIDVVFSKLWLGRTYLGLKGTLVCADITEQYTIQVENPVSVHCQDALYFLEDKQDVLAKLRVFSTNSTLAIGHCHTIEETTYSNGFPLSLKEYRELASKEAKWFTDSQLIEAWLKNTKLTTSEAEEVLQRAKALSWIEKGELSDRNKDLFILHAPKELCLNPLINSRDLKSVQWPSENYREEYSQDYGYFLETIEHLSCKEAAFEDTEFHYKNRVLIENIEA